MTQQDRDLAIADNIAYVNTVVEAIAHERIVNRTLVFAGFSQGVAMAFRAAAASRRPVAGVIVCGGDVPPELEPAALARVPTALVGRGLRDGWYTSEKADADARRLRDAGVRLTTVDFDGGHEWPAAVHRRGWRIPDRVPMTTIRRATPDEPPCSRNCDGVRSDRPDAHEHHDAFVVRCAEWSATNWPARRGACVGGSSGRPHRGNVWLGTIPKLPNPGAEREQHAYISNVYVTSSSRGGVGRALLEAALADAAGRADRVILWPSGLSKTLYARYGFTAMGDLMELKCAEARRSSPRSPAEHRRTPRPAWPSLFSAARTNDRRLRRCGGQAEASARSTPA